MAYISPFSSGERLTGAPYPAPDDRANGVMPTHPFPSSMWTTPLVANPVLAANSATIISNWMSLVSGVPEYLGLFYNTPTRYVIHGNQTPVVTVHVNPDNRHGNNVTGDVQVPIPHGALPDPGSGGDHDHKWIIWDIDNQISWEMWGVGQITGGYQDGTQNPDGTWSCNTMNQAKTDGTFNGAFDSSLTSPFSSTAASLLPYHGGLTTMADLLSGSIQHALSLTAQSGYCHVLPASQNDPGTPSSSSIPEGSRFFMPSSVSMPGGLPPLAQMVFTALQTYGAYITDGTGATVLIDAENSVPWINRYGQFKLLNFLAGLPTSSGAGGVLAGIPWSSMKVAAPATAAAIISGDILASAPVLQTPGSGGAGTGTIYLNWNQPTLGTGALTGYQIYFGTTSSGESPVSIFSTYGSPNFIPAYTLNKISGTTYYIKVAAVTNSGIGAPSNEVSTTAP
jgi:hypothetical protein